MQLLFLNNRFPYKHRKQLLVDFSEALNKYIQEYIDLVESGLVDYVAMDIKNSKKKSESKQIVENLSDEEYLKLFTKKQNNQ